MSDNINKTKYTRANTGLLLTSVSLIALYSGVANAACVVSTGNATLTTPCTNANISGAPYNNGSLTNATTVSGGVDLIFGSGLNQYSLTNSSNSSIVSATNYGLYITGAGGTVGNLLNYGQISSGAAQFGAIFVGSGVTTSNLINYGSGVISTSDASSSAIANVGAITIFQNDGVISGANNGIFNTGTIGSLTNSGTILGNSATASGIYSDGGEITSITNNGTISGNSNAIRIFNSPTANVSVINNGSLSNTNSSIPTVNISGVNTAVFSQNAGTINGLVQISAGTVNMNMAGGSIFGDVKLGGTTSTTLTYSGGSLNGSLIALQPNLAVNVNAGTLSAYSYGRNSTPIQAINVASGATLVNNSSAYVAMTNINSGATFNNLGRVFGDVTNNGTMLLDNNSAINGAVYGTGTTNVNSTFLQAGPFYQGITNINNGGLLNATADINSNVNINSGGIADLGGNSIAINAVSLAGGTIKNGSLTGAITSTGGTVNSISGAASLTNNSGTTTLTGTNGYTGATTVSGGTVKAGAANSFSANSATSINAGGVLDLNNFSQTIGSLSGLGSVLLGTGNLRLGGDGTSTIYSGNISGTGSLVKSGAGTFTLSGQNIYSGGTLVLDGTLRAGAVNSFSPNSTFTSYSGTTIDLNNFDQTISRMLNLNGNITLGTATLTIGSSATSAISGNISGAGGGLSKVGAGVLFLAGSNSYTGATNVNAGIMSALAANAFSSSSAHTVSSGATLDLNNRDNIIGSLAGAGSTTLGSGTLTAGGDNTSTSYTGSMTGRGGLTKAGAGTMTVSQLGYSGATAVAGGVLRAAGANALASNSATIVASGATLDLNNFNNTVGSLAGAGATTLGSGTLTAGGDNTSTSYTGSMTGTGGLTKAGTGTMTVDTLAFTGATNVNAGTLALTNGSTIASAVNVANAATFNNAGTTNGVVTNNCNGTVNNSGTMANSVNNSGTLTNTGSINGALNNNSNCGTVINTTGTLAGTVSNSGTLTNSLGGAISGVLTNNAGGTATNAGQISNTVSNSGTFTNSVGGTMTGAVTNAQSAQFANNGSIAANVTNNGVFANASGAGVGGTFLNGATGTLTNRGTLIGTVTNNGTGANFGTFSSTLLNNGILDNSGLISGAVSNTGLFGNGGTLSSSLTNNGLAYNYTGGVISGPVDNSAVGSVFNNQGRVDGAVTNIAGAQIDNSGRINGNVTNAGVFNHSGTVANSFANNGTLNISGNSSHITGALSGTGTTNISGSFSQEAAISNGVININNGGNFYTTSGVIATSAMNINQGGVVVAGSSISAPLNIADGGLLATLGTQTIAGDVTNSGAILPIDSSYNLNVTGNYSQTSTGGFVTPIASTTEYSKLIATGQVSAATGSTVLAILDPSLRIAPGTVFAGVLQAGAAGGTRGNITVETISDRYTLTGVWNGNNYDLGWGNTYTGALARYTLASISAVQGPTLNAMHQRYAVLNAVMEYDCNKFEAHNFCLSAQARATGFGTQATGSGVFNIAYRPTQQTRIGAYIDYQAAAGNPTTYTPTIAGALNTGSVNYGYDNATFGGYLGFSQSGYSGRILNTGFQAFVSGGYNPGKIQTTRSLILDQYNADFVDSQPGSGSASLNSYYVRGMAGYGYALTEQATLMPYLGVRYTDVTRGGYMEGYNSIVTQPLVYNSYYERLVTGFGGLMLNGQLTDRFGVLAGLGAELDFSRSASSFSGYSPIPITILNTNQSMTAFGFQHGGSWNGFRPTGNLGAYYDVMPNHRIMINGYAGQQAWSTRTFTSGLLGYQIAF